MRYLDFVEKTKGMTPTEKSQFFDDLGVEGQNELMGDYSGRVTKEYVLLQTRLVQAASMIENEPDEEKRTVYMKVYNALEVEFDKEKRKLGFYEHV